MKKTFIVKAFYDDEAKVWCASSENFVGVATWAKTMDALIKKLNIMVPEMLEANGYIKSSQEEIPYQVISDCVAAAYH